MLFNKDSTMKAARCRAILAAALYAAAFMCRGAAAEEQARTLTVGAILPLTGIAADLGAEARKGIELAVQEAELQGAHLRVIYEDDRMPDPRGALAAAQKLLYADAIDVAVTVLVEESHPIASVFNQRRVPLLVLWDSSETVSAGGKFIFSNGFSTEGAGRSMAAFAAANLQLDAVALISHEDPWSRTLSEAFAAAFRSAGGRIVFREEISPEASDMRATVARVKKTHAQGIYLPMIPPGLVGFVKQLREQGVKAELMTGDAFLQGYVREAGRAAEGVYMTNGEYPGLPDLGARYRRRFGSEPAEISYVACGYDGIMKIARAAAAAGSGGDLRGAMLRALGGRQAADRAQSVFQIRNGQRVQLDGVYRAAFSPEARAGMRSGGR